MTAATAGRIELVAAEGRAPHGMSGSMTVGAMILFGAIDVAMHFLRNDLDPMANAQSRYVLGEWGFLMTVGFMVMGIGSLCLAAGVSRRIAGSHAACIGLLMLAAWGIAIMTAALVRIDPLGVFGSIGGALHSAVALIGYICAAIGAVSLSIAFRDDERWSRLYRPALLLGSIIVAAIVLLVAAGMAEDRSMFYPLSQRLVILAIAIWMMFVGEKLRTGM